MIVLFKCTCMISSLCILRWQCVLGNVNDANSNYLRNQQQTDQKIVPIGLKTPSEFFLVPGGLRGLLKEIRFITFFSPCTETLSQKKWFLFREQQFFPVLGGFTECFFKMLNLPSQPTKLPMDLTAIVNPWHSSLFQWYPREYGSTADHFQFSLVLDKTTPTSWMGLNTSGV